MLHLVPVPSCLCFKNNDLRWAKGRGAGSEDDSSDESEDECAHSSSSDSDSEGGGYTGKGRRVRGARCTAVGAKKGLRKKGAAGAAGMPEALLSQFDGSIEVGHVCVCKGTQGCVKMSKPVVLQSQLGRGIEVGPVYVCKSYTRVR
eukprot:scaffold312227_cov18-Tisochrysis_lutea.AAC.3